MVNDEPVSCICSPITIEDGVWLGLGVTVFSGIIGTNAFVAANSLVNSDIEANTFASGYPAKE